MSTQCCPAPKLGHSPKLYELGFTRRGVLGFVFRAALCPATCGHSPNVWRHPGKPALQREDTTFPFRHLCYDPPHRQLGGGEFGLNEGKEGPPTAVLFLGTPGCSLSTVSGEKKNWFRPDTMASQRLRHQFKQQYFFLAAHWEA